ncbi:hypothetical protein D3C85_1706160 [compost metagenome]
MAPNSSRVDCKGTISAAPPWACAVDIQPGKPKVPKVMASASRARGFLFNEAMDVNISEFLGKPVTAHHTVLQPMKGFL